MTHRLIVGGLLLALGALVAVLLLRRGVPGESAGGRAPARGEPEWARGLLSDAQHAEAARLGVPVAYEETELGMRFVLIPGGAFVMGKKGEWKAGPEHRVTVAPFYLSIHEITNAQDELLLPSPEVAALAVPEWNRPRQPASIFLGLGGEGRLLAAMNEKSVRGGYRLPSEAEWEWACRAGGAGSLPGTFSWTEAQERGDPGAPADVGSLAPNAWGLFDMLGNAEEWCEDDWHDSYAGAPGDGRAWVDTPRSRIRAVRGGQWTDENIATCARRTGVGIDVGVLAYIGLRPARSIPDERAP